MSKKFFTFSVICGLLIISSIVFWYVRIKMPYDNAVKDYKATVLVINEKNAALDKAVSQLQKQLDSSDKPLDNAIIEIAKNILKSAVTNKIVVKEMPEKTEDIVKLTAELKKPLDYSNTIEQINSAYNKYDLSCKQYKHFLAPTEEFVVQRLHSVDEIKEVRAATEEDDVNGLLHKQGSYTAVVYFESKNVNQNNIPGHNLSNKGTRAGGSIEVFANESDAKKRDAYIGAFDGTILSAGSHKMVGTVLIRCSDELTASKQKALEKKIFDAFVKL